MKEFVIFNSIVMAASLITPQTQGKINLFDDTNAYCLSNITDLPETELIHLLMANDGFRSFIFRTLGMSPTAFYKIRVTKPIIDNPYKKPGDVDLLICDRNNPSQAIAFEGKRIKVETIDEQDEIIRKLDGKNIVEGVKQARGLRDYGFYNTYLTLLVETDGRNRTKYNEFSRHSNEITLGKLYDFPYRDKLYQEIGIIIIEIVQPTRKHYSEISQVNVGIVKEAKPLQQPVELTNKIRFLLN